MVSRTQTVVLGRCLCGACSFELIGKHNWVGHCHCKSCRKATSSPFTTWIGQENGFWSFTGNKPVHYQSSPGNVRGFCGTCGSPMFYKSSRYPNEMHFYAALLDDPDGVEPSVHSHAAEMLAWVHLADDLPRE
ncbi:GFA family protein [Devosia sp.]|uniref:GFA family protein n=1 Tax=Devosia sp. TaxID=1871048 RepID=UPI002FC87A6E